MTAAERRKLIEDFVDFIETTPGIGRGPNFREVDYAICGWESHDEDGWVSISDKDRAHMITRFLAAEQMS